MMQDIHLEDVRTELLRGGAAASLRGSGAAAFVFAEHHGRAIELSCHQGRLWAEFWEASSDEDAQPIKERFFSSAKDAIEAISEWLFLTRVENQA
jgi:hypothetical protein